LKVYSEATLAEGNQLAPATREALEPEHVNPVENPLAYPRQSDSKDLQEGIHNPLKATAEQSGVIDWIWSFGMDTATFTLPAVVEQFPLPKVV
jgi:hypothetical protein